MIAAIIPARGGSKGITRKNLVSIGGSTLVERSVRHALGSTLVDEVWCSTDDDEIAAAAEKAGALIHRRKSETATDTATSDAAVLEWLERWFYPPMETSRNQAMGSRWAGGRSDPDLIVFLQATSPLRRPTDIDGAVAKLKTAGADSLFSARFLQGYTWTDNGSLTPNYASRQPRQEHDAVTLEENGSIYVFKPWVLRKTKQRLGGKIAAYLMNPLDSLQIDEPDDIPTLEALASVRG